VDTPGEQVCGRRIGYRQVADLLSNRVRDGAFPDGRLPAEDALASEFGVARDTVRRALSLLADEGLIRSTHGRGHFVCQSGDPAAGMPKYLVVAEDLRRSIESGSFRSGEALPTEAAIQETFSVSRTTVRRALLELEAAGLIERRNARRIVRDSVV
jgi:DNA-binding GntR family transcriptional regulator